jgi:hypothetical protein
VLLGGASEEAVPVSLRLLEEGRGRVEEGHHRTDHRRDRPTPVLLQQPLAVLHGSGNRSRVLPGHSDEVPEVHPADPEVEGPFDPGLHLLIAVDTASRPACHLAVVALRRQGDGGVGVRSDHPPDQILGRELELLVVHRLHAGVPDLVEQGAKAAVGLVIGTDGVDVELLHVLHPLHRLELERDLLGGLLDESVVLATNPLEGLARATAPATGVSAAGVLVGEQLPDGEQGSRPVLYGVRPVDATPHRRRLVGEATVANLPVAGLPEEVGNAGGVLAREEGAEEAVHGLERIVAPHHHVHVWQPDDLAGVVSRRDSAEHDRDVGAEPLQFLGHRQASLDRDHPVQVEPQQPHVERTCEGGEIHLRETEEERAQVDDPDAVAPGAEVAAQLLEPQREDLVERRDRDVP